MVFLRLGFGWMMSKFLMGAWPSITPNAGVKPRIIVAIEEAPKHPPKFRQPEARGGNSPSRFDKESIVW
jgi:hypothetical protein